MVSQQLVFIRELRADDQTQFLTAMQASQGLHHPWVCPPLTAETFAAYFHHYQHANCKSFLLFDIDEQLAGVFNLSEIVRGSFQNAYLGFYAVQAFAGKGYMSAGMKMLLEKAFTELALHRIEANIQPSNHRSIHLVKSNHFRHEGFSPHYLKINGEWRDHERWAITLEDWLVL